MRVYARPICQDSTQLLAGLLIDNPNSLGCFFVHSSGPCSDHAPFSVWQRLCVPSSPQLLRASSSHRCTASTIRPPGRSATSASSHPTVLQLAQSVVRISTLALPRRHRDTRRRSQVEQGRLQAGARIARRRHALDDPAEGPVAGHGLREDGRLLRRPRRRRRFEGTGRRAMSGRWSPRRCTWFCWRVGCWVSRPLGTKPREKTGHPFSSERRCGARLEISSRGGAIPCRSARRRW